MNKAMLTVLVLFVTAIFLPSAFAINYYDAYFYNIDTTGNPQEIITPSWYSTETNCTDFMYVKINSTSLSGATYTMTTEYYSPDDTIRGISTRNLALNVTCLQQGQTFTNEKLNNYLETKAIITRVSGSSHTSTLTQHIECGTASDWVNISTSSNLTDSRGKLPNVYFDYTCGVAMPPPHRFLTESTFNDCTGVAQYQIAEAEHYYCCGGGCSNTNEHIGYYYMPFTTGDSGYIEYNYSLPFTPFGGYEDWGYYELADTDTYVSLNGTGIRDGSLNLISNTEYVWYIQVGAPAGNQSHANIDLDINIYSPTWDCGDWSECEYGQRFRTCTDPLGKVPPRIEYEGCITDAYFNLTLGFEAGQLVTGAYRPGICTRTFYPFCYYDILRLDNIEYPKDWTVTNTGRNYFLRMSEDYATEGSRSLKMWYIPPGYQYEYPTEICNWSNIGKFPSIYTGINDTLFIQYNITFPATYMTIEYDVKRCNEPVTKWDGWCGTECYSFNGTCDTDNLHGVYLNRLYNPSTAETIYNFYDDAGPSWETKYIDLSNAGLVVGETYNLIFAVNPEHKTDADGQCVYIDNVRISIRTAEIPCEENFCIDENLYKPSKINDTVCVYDVIYNARECIDPQNFDAYDNFKPYCVDLTYWYWNNVTLEWESIPNSTVCQIEEDINTIFDVPEAVQPIFDALEPTGFGFLAYLFSPVVIAIIIALIAAIYSVLGMGLTGTGAGMSFVLVFISVLGVFSIIGLFPVWFIIVLIIISGLGIGLFLTRN